jgi:glycosyl transferase family 87
VTATETPNVSGSRHSDRLTGERFVWLASAALLGALSVAAVVIVFQNAIQTNSVAIDFHQFYGAAKAILHGQSPYLPDSARLTTWGGPYPYPPLLALLAIPLTVIPFQAAGLLVMAILVLVALATLYVLDVRDWRCYGLALLWPPVISAIQTGNVTLWFALAAALAWRFRARLVPGAVAIGVTLAAKFFLWPLVVWLVATRRFASAVLATAVGTTLLLASWAVIGFAGFLDYPDLVRKLEATVGEDSYTAYIVGLDIGLPSPMARTLWLMVGFGLLAAAVVVGWRGEERSAFVLAIGASLALTPIVWLHYFALLLVVVAVSSPRLGFVWFCPLALILTPGSGHPTPFQTAWTLGVVAFVFALSIRSSTAECAPFVSDSTGRSERAREAPA